MDVTPKKISVIGCGWLGLPLAIELVKSNYHVKGSTTKIEKLDELVQASIEPYHLMLSDELYVDDKGLFDSDIVVVNVPPGRGGDSIISSYRHKIIQLIDELKTHALENVIFVSSTGVYQNTFGTVDEAMICHPDKASGQAVLAGESVVINSGLPYTILRMSGLVGGKRQPGNWFKGRRDEPGGDTPVNMVHQKDGIDAIIKVIKSPPRQSNVYNICADEHPIKKEFYAQQSENIGVESPTFLPGVLPHKLVSNEKFKSDFEFTYTYPNPILFR